MPRLKRLFLTSVILNVGWTIISSQVERLLNNNFSEVIVGTGFLIIYSLTYFLSFERSKKTLLNFSMLILTMIAIFLIASFVPPFFFIHGKSDVSVIGFFLVSSVIAFTCIVAIVGHYTGIENKLSTILVGSLVTVVIAYVFVKYLPENYDTATWNKIVSPLALGFCAWQILTTVLIGRSITHPASLPPTAAWQKQG